MQLGKTRRDWPKLDLPAARGSITAADVLAAPPGADRDAAIDAWCRSVWEACRPHRDTVIALLQEYSIGRESSR